MLYLTSKEIAWIFVILIVIVVVGYVAGIVAAIRSRSFAASDAGRREEEQRLNDGWRIAFIQTGARPATGRIVVALLVGPIIVLFLIGALDLTANQSTSYLPGILMVGSLVAGVLLYLAGGLIVRRQRAGWTTVPARCTDQEIRRMIVVSENAAKREAWLCRIVCEFDHAGHSYRMTPIVHRKFARVTECDFPSEQEAGDFLRARVSSAGHCQVRVDPTNPLEGELC